MKRLLLLMVLFAFVGCGGGSNEPGSKGIPPKSELPPMKAPKDGVKQPAPKPGDAPKKSFN